MPSLHQLVAAMTTITSDAASANDRLHHDAQAHHIDGPFHGKVRTYEPKEDGGDKLPSEVKRVQRTADGIIDSSVAALTDFYDATATRDWANCDARADVVVEGRTVVKDAPVPFLLWLEKQLIHQKTLISKLPVLSPEERWHWDETQECYVSEPVESVRSSKLPNNHVLHEGNATHPPQVQVYTVDVPQGTWTTVKHSGAMPRAQQTELLGRIRKLLIAVKYAREAANHADIQQVHVAAGIFGYLYSN